MLPLFTEKQVSSRVRHILPRWPYVACESREELGPFHQSPRAKKEKRSQKIVARMAYSRIAAEQRGIIKSNEVIPATLIGIKEPA